MKANEGTSAAVEDIDCGAGSRVDFEQERTLPIHHEIGRGQPFDFKG
jgi:hypothetical protein